MLEDLGISVVAETGDSSIVLTVGEAIGDKTFFSVEAVMDADEALDLADELRAAAETLYPELGEAA